MTWAPGPSVNCLIGPGDSTKTTILDALELCLNPRASFVADDCDSYNLDVEKPVRIVVELPVEGASATPVTGAVAVFSRRGNLANRSTGPSSQTASGRSDRES